jgi:hypothetical protein
MKVTMRHAYRNHQRLSAVTDGDLRDPGGYPDRCRDRQRCDDFSQPYKLLEAFEFSESSCLTTWQEVSSSQVLHDEPELVAPATFQQIPMPSNQL